MSNHAHLITSVTGVWLLKPEVFIQCSQTTGREGAGHTHNSNILCLKDPNSQPSADFGSPLEQSHKNHTASTRPKCTQFLHGRSVTLPTQELTSFTVWVEQHHLLTTTPTSHLRCRSTVHTIILVSCPDSLSRAEKESGETRIQFWFPMYARDVL